MITPILDEASALPGVLEAMRAQRLDGDVEFLLIDGGSTDASIEIVAAAAAADARFVPLTNPKRHIPGGLNVGLAHAKGQYVARMDAHTVYPPDYLQRGVQRLRRGDVTWVSGPQIARGAGRWSHRVALALSSRLGMGGADYRRQRAAEYDVDSGFTGVWRRETLVALDGWDESWLVNEDGELAARLRADGGRIVCVPEMAADYLPRDDLRRLARQYWRYGQFRVKTAVAHPQTLRRSHLLPPAMVVAAAVSVLPGRAGRPGRAGLGLYAGALTGAGLRLARKAGARDGAGAVLVMVTMHLAWGAGFVAGCARFGAPLRALLAQARGLLKS